MQLDKYLAELNKIAACDKKFTRKDKAIKFLSEKENISAKDVIDICNKKSGMLGISAMVLPGISGSTILLIFGTYMPIMTAIKDVLHFSVKHHTGQWTWFT